jgi:trehalose-6-phosphate synthase
VRPDQVLPVSLTASDHKLYYNGVCNGLLWPMLHSMIERAEFGVNWDAYVEVNRKFADVTLDAVDKCGNGSKVLVWIHDYHLLLAGQMLRETIGKKRGSGNLKNPELPVHAVNAQF